MAAEQNAPNMFDLRPLRALRWETGVNDAVVLLVPKFRNRVLVRWFLPLLRRPDFRVQLDEVGSFVWQLCDGTHTVLEISVRLEGRFGEKSLPERLARFMNTMAREKFVQLN
jgi:hypothetical protein